LRDDAFGREDCVTLAQLIEYLEREQTVNESIREMPVTLLFFILFWYLVVNHFKTAEVHEHYKVMKVAFAIPEQDEERGGGGRGGGGGPKSTGWAGRRDELLRWTATEFAPNVFWGDQHEDLSLIENTKFLPAGRIATYNQLIGGLRMRKVTDVRGECVDKKIPSLIEWYHPGGHPSGDGPCRFYGPSEITADSQGDIEDVWFYAQQPLVEVVDHLNKMQEDAWVNELTRLVEIRTATYNAETGMFGLTTLSFFFQPHGVIEQSFRADAWAVRAYPASGWFVLVLADLGFLCVVLFFVVSELQQIIWALMQSKTAATMLKLYGSDVWNFMDWLSIFATIFSVVYFYDIMGSTDALCTVIAELPRLGALPRVKEELIALTGVSAAGYEEQMARIYADFEAIAYTWDSLRMFAGFFAFTIMMRFFKSFRANARLSVVTETLARAGVDGIHFFLVFIIIFLCFVLTAHILFGHSHEAFDSLWDAMHTCFLVLMGDFDLWRMMEINYVFAMLWFWLFEILVFLILFNMLLAVVMDVYFQVKSGQQDAQPIWEQAAQRYREMRSRKVDKDKVTMVDGVAHKQVDTRPSANKILGVLHSDNHDLTGDDFLTAETLVSLPLTMDMRDAVDLVRKVAAANNEASGPEEGLSVTDAVRAIGRVDQGVNEIFQRQRTVITELKAHEDAWDDAAWGRGLDEVDEDISHHLEAMEEKLSDVLSRLVVEDENKEDPEDWRVLTSSKIKALMDNNVVQDE
jgi:hypothetical protein